MHSIYLWIGFHIFIFAMLALDLGVFHKSAHEVKFKESVLWTITWVLLAFTFNLGLFFFEGSKPAVEFLTGYLIEKSLSVDNIFVFLMVFTYFKVPAKYQHKILFWGIIGALIMRAIFIFSGIALMQKLHWMIYVFGGFLIFTGIKMALPKKEELDLDSNFLLRLIRKFIPVTQSYREDHFFVRERGKLIATPMFVVLIFIEFTDVIFALDSIPAILAVTQDSFIVYTSNIFAILGLRSLYFALAGFAGMLKYLHLGLASILCFVGVKMMISSVYKIEPLVSLMVILSLLTIAVMASLLAKEKQPK